MGQPSDQVLYKGACAGDRAAFQQLAERHHAFTMQVAARATSGGPSVAEDIAHRAWLTFCEHIQRVQTGATKPLELKNNWSLMSWLKTVTTNLAMDEHRRRKRVTGRELRDDDAIDDSELDEPLLFEERRSAVWQAFRRISERCQELLLLLIQDPPLDYRSISELWGRPVGAIGPTRARCMERLRAEL